MEESPPPAWNICSLSFRIAAARCRRTVAGFTPSSRAISPSSVLSHTRRNTSSCLFVSTRGAASRTRSARASSSLPAPGSGNRFSRISSPFSRRSRRRRASILNKPDTRFRVIRTIHAHGFRTMSTAAGSERAMESAVTHACCTMSFAASRSSKTTHAALIIVSHHLPAHSKRCPMRNDHERGAGFQREVSIHVASRRGESQLQCERVRGRGMT